MWQPTTSLATLRLRARLLAKIRQFFAERRVLEVETPVLSAFAATDPHIESFQTDYTGPGMPTQPTLYLHTSPEFAMKRLLAAGSGSIYQIAKVFRNGELGRQHHPEFTLLEWYRVGFDHHQLMDEVEQLINTLSAGFLQLAPSRRWAYRELFLHHLAIDPLRSSAADLSVCATQLGFQTQSMPNDDPDAWLALLMTHYIEPRLDKDRLVFIYDYPASQAALARIRPEQPPVAERFELYLNGLELANGFHELTDAAEQQRRFEQDNRQRIKRGLPAMPVDWHLLAALTHLPDCAGVALGIDRLLMLVSQSTSIDQVLAFDVTRA